MEHVKEKALSEVFGVIQKFVKKIIDEKKWFSFFSDNLSIYIDKEKSEFYESQLNGIFTESTIKKMSGLILKNNGFTFNDVLKKEIQYQISVWDVESYEKEVFLCRLLESVYECLKQEYPDLYSQFITGNTYEIVKNTNKELLQVKKNIDAINKVISSPEMVISSNDLEWKMVSNSEKRVDFSFYESDDKDFKKDFIDKINNKNNIYVTCYSRWEALFVILSELKKYGKNAYIVYSKNDWKKIENCNLFTNEILIPFFMDDIIMPIDNNINIFIYDKYIIK